jgi:hypothetical protein
MPAAILTMKPINGESYFHVKEKSGFKATAKVCIYQDNSIFYGLRKNQEIFFNLPPGYYSTEWLIQPLSQPIKIKIPTRRKRERFNIALPKNVFVRYGNNPNKATICLETGEILIDNSFLNAPELVKKFIMYHEIAHYYYKSEEFCDEYAQERLIEDGYNLSQVHNATAKSLNPANPRNRFCEEKTFNAKLSK